MAFKTQLTEDKIQKRLSSFFAPNSVKYDIDNLYIFFWESDKLLETKSGYLYEFEIKISRSDFKADFKKKEKHLILEGKEKYMPSFLDYYDTFKSQCPTIKDWEKMCEERYPYHLTKYHKRPNYFYYAVPEGMIDKEEIPEYAGLIYVGEECGFSIIKKAPCLHKEKYSDLDLNLAEKFYYATLRWREKCLDWEKAYNATKTQLNEELTVKNQEKSYSQLKEELSASRNETENERQEKEKYQNAYLIKLSDYRYLSLENRLIRREIKKIVPDFNFAEFDIKVEERYKELYGPLP